MLLFHSENDKRWIEWKYVFLLASWLTAFKKVLYVGAVAANI